MARTTNERLSDELTARDVDLDRYQRGLLTRVLGLLARLEEDIVGRIAALDPSSVQPRYKEARLTRLLAEVQARVDRYAEALDAAVLPDLQELVVDEARFGVTLLSTLPPVALDVIAPAVANLRSAAMSRPFQGRLLREWVKEHPASVRFRLRNVIRQGVAEGKTIDDMVRAIRGTKASNFTDGVMAINRRGAEAMVRTAVSHTVTVAREQTYADNSDLVKGVRWTSTLDSRTSDVCMARDGKVFPVNKGPRPPAHIRCRSTTVPVLKSWKELGIPLGEAPEGTRASMDGQVPAGQTYSQWLRGRSREFQNEVLGPGRADIFRSGVDLDKFVDNSGRSYTLEQLRQRAKR